MSKGLDDAVLGPLAGYGTSYTYTGPRDPLAGYGSTGTGVVRPTATAGDRPFLDDFKIETLRELHCSLCARAATLMQAKNHDYTGGQHPLANFLSADARGVPAELGLMLRVDDKLKRLQTFITKGTLKVSGEGVKDSIIDVINYMVLLAGLIYCRTGDPTLLGKEDV